MTSTQTPSRNRIIILSLFGLTSRPLGRDAFAALTEIVITVTCWTCVVFGTNWELHADIDAKPKGFAFIAIGAATYSLMLWFALRLRAQLGRDSK